MKKNSKLARIIGIVLIIAAVVTYIVVRPIIKENSANNNDDSVYEYYVPGYENAAFGQEEIAKKGNLLDFVGDDVYVVAMELNKFIRDEKFLTANFDENDGSIEATLKEDYQTIVKFDEMFSSIVNDPDATGFAETEEDYLLQMVGSAFSIQWQQKVLLSQKAIIDGDPDEWVYIDVSKLDEVLALYQSIWEEITWFVATEDIDAITAYYDERPWVNKISKYSDYLAKFSNATSGY